MDLDGYVKFLEQQGLSPAGIETRKRMLKDAEKVHLVVLAF